MRLYSAEPAMHAPISHLHRVFIEWNINQKYELLAYFMLVAGGWDPGVAIVDYE